MKKIKILFICFLFFIIITGCSSNNETKKEEENIKEKENLKKSYADYYYENYEESYLVMVEDVTNDDTSDMIVVTHDSSINTYKVEVFTLKNNNVENIFSKEGAGFKAGGVINMYLYEENDKTYFLDGVNKMWQGSGTYGYELFLLSNDGEIEKVEEDYVKGTPTDEEFDEVDKKYREYAKKSIELVVTIGPEGINRKEEFNEENVFGDIKEEQDDIEENTKNKIGNTSSNITNDGYFTYQEDKVYYADVDGKRIYSANKGLSNIKIVYQGKGRIKNLNIIGEYLYFTENINANIYLKKIKTTGEALETLETNIEQSSLYVDSKYIYYAKEYDLETYDIYRMDLFGQNKEKLVNTEHPFLAVNNNILYYSDANINYKMDLDTKKVEETVIYPYSVIFYKDRVFQIASRGNNVLDTKYYLAEVINEEEKLLYRVNSANMFAVIDDKLYFSMENEELEEYCLYSSDLNGKNLKLLVEYASANLIFEIGDDYVYYFDSLYSNFRLKRISRYLESTIEEAGEIEWIFK